MVKHGSDGLVMTKKNVKILIFYGRNDNFNGIVLLISLYALSMCDINVYNEMSL